MIAVTANLHKLIAAITLAFAIVGCSGAVPATSAGPASPAAPPPGRTGSPVSTAGPGVEIPTLPPIGPATPAGSAASIDACALLSDADIAAGTAATVTSRAPSTLTRVFPSVCDIELAPFGSLTVSVMAVGGRSMYETSFEPFIGQDSFLDRAVEGLGDKAGISGDDDLMVLSGDVLFDLFLLSTGRDDTEAVLRYLAEIVLAKLPCIAAGCAGYVPPSPLPTPARADVCALLTDDEVEEAFGIALLGKELLPGRDPHCLWTLDSELYPGADYFDITIKATGGRSDFDLYAGAYEPPLEHVTGLGEDAIKTGTIPGGTIWIIDGDRLVTVKFSTPPSVDDPYALATSLAKIAMSRLGPPANS